MLFDAIQCPPPLVSARERISDDPVTWGPAGEWLPDDWESGTYPLLDNLESIRQWLSYQWNSAEQIGNGPSGDNGLPPGFIRVGDMTPIVRDAYRLVRHLERTRGWTKGPTLPEKTFLSTVEGHRELAVELGWIGAWMTRAARQASEVQAAQENGPKTSLGRQTDPDKEATPTPVVPTAAQIDQAKPAVKSANTLFLEFLRDPDRRESGLRQAAFEQERSISLIQKVLASELPRLLPHTEPRTPEKGMSVSEAEQIARQLAKERGAEFTDQGYRDWAKDIGCTPSVARKTSFWQEVMNRSGRGRVRRTKGTPRRKKPKAVPLDSRVEIEVAGKQGQAQLDRLIAEQEADAATQVIRKKL